MPTAGTWSGRSSRPTSPGSAAGRTRPRRGARSRAPDASPSGRRGRAGPAREAAARRFTATGAPRGPVPRSHAQEVSVGEKKNALKAVLSQRLREERLLVLDKMELDSHRTRDLKAAVGGLGITGKTLFVESRENERLALASRNVREWKLVDPLRVNVYDVLSHGTLVLSRGALDRVVENLTEKK
ncbi:MAG TPA: uL4 family ribosomal protein [Thermoanaerobaculia bacterium]|nr:uL4 family ribosomal protein [Thermoanaerobaculia bacterium]